jgi:Raf kinase inhibitor-like YbhB/YbcL family protein
MAISRRAVMLVSIALAMALLTLAACSRQAGADSPALSPDAPPKEAQMLTISSPAFEAGGMIPVEYAATAVPGGENISLPYEWRGAPAATKSFALTIVDLNPVAHSWVHWMVTGIPPDTTSLPRGASRRAMPLGSIEHPNTSGGRGYDGPDPPVGSGRHEYRATIYALDIAAPDPHARSLREFTDALDGHVLASASCSGFFGR